MKVHSVYIRFYKSFNFDYLRKFDQRVEPRPWENLGDRWEPYVRVRLDPRVTAVVGANESGKSHLLSAIEKVMTGDGISRDDFCRYSSYFTVQQGQVRYPDFGVEFDCLDEEDVARLREICELEDGAEVERLLIFRENRSKMSLYLPNGDDYNRYEINSGRKTDLDDMLPHVFRIMPDVPLPDSVPLRFLIDSERYKEIDEDQPIGNRDQRDALVKTFIGRFEWFESPAAIQQSSKQIANALAALRSGAALVDAEALQQYQLAKDLLCNVAGIDPATFEDLQQAIRDGKDGYANGLIQQINDDLAVALNFPRRWVQDRDFQLIVSPREHDLVFTVRDRTGTEYSFGERSHGLKYFLSYYIQLLAHVDPPGRHEILLMDEPDAYLSSQGQQDLLKLFEMYASPVDGRKPMQVVYVTHSPFAIDKNHSERIRVLEKGSGEEGTRVVGDAARNHYEPLRSSFGTFVAETVFIGGGNLLVEGSADQVLLAGVAAYLRSRGVSALETLDLNELTIVPAGSASAIPYLVYLARGRDVEQPAVVVLLDSDTPGNDARQELKRGGPRRKGLIKLEYVFQIGDLAKTGSHSLLPMPEPLAIEDLIPLEIAAAAATRYLHDAVGITSAIVNRAEVEEHFTTTRSVFKAVEILVAEKGKGNQLAKVGFARSVIEHLEHADQSIDSIQQLEQNFRLLFRELGERLRKAEEELSVERVGKRVAQRTHRFITDHPHGAKRENVLVLIENVTAALDDTKESDHVRAALLTLRRDFISGGDLAEPIADFDMLIERLQQLRYVGRLETQDESSAVA